MGLTDWLLEIREEQLDLARRISDQIYDEVKPYIENGKWQGLNKYLVFEPDYLTAEKIDKNLKFKEVDMAKHNLEIAGEIVDELLDNDSLSAVQGYTDWQMSYIVQNNDFNVLPFEEIDSKKIADQKVITLPLLERAVSYMHSQLELPLLGEIRLGQFHPDPDTFQRWKSLYDWEKSPE